MTSRAAHAELSRLQSELEDALSAEVQWRGEIGSDDHLAVTGRVIEAREALRKTGAL